ncbi:MAG: hypothetical protein ACE5FS_05135 [Paracoccaceae bacterium]
MPEHDLSIACARSEVQAAQVRPLTWEFIGYLRARCPGIHAEIDDYLIAQKFAEQLDNFRPFSRRRKANSCWPRSMANPVAS